MARPVPCISLRDFDARKEEIGRQLIDAAENIGFFILTEQESPSKGDIEEMFEYSTKFFALPDEIKSHWAFIREKNTGWERDAQIRPSTGVADPKESLQVQWFRRDTYWPDDISASPDAPAAFKDEETAAFLRDFHPKLVRFHEQVQELSMRVLSYFAVAMGHDEDYFRKAHDVSYEDALSTVRLLRYHAVEKVEPGRMRAGAHADFDVLTLLFQQTGGDGLEVCPGREAHDTFATGDDWTPVPARTGDITVNIGDMLMAWSDDRFKSLIHRVRMPGENDSHAPRNSIAFFTQPRPDVIVQGPAKKYEPMTASEYIMNAMKKYYRGNQTPAA